ncbi:hypothetical protein [Oryza sativa Japonica Group]|uniref:Uncharacterized protein P0025D05.16 n=1 Tax=Oryza sativa subsp. japonica TaxID=39947 RepID=Q5NBK0_ORYSJ|nr:hypothetical protein [Oryza sativa Japonica Group]
MESGRQWRRRMEDDRTTPTTREGPANTGRHEGGRAKERLKDVDLLGWSSSWWRLGFGVILVKRMIRVLGIDDGKPHITIEVDEINDTDKIVVVVFDEISRRLDFVYSSFISYGGFLRRTREQSVYVKDRPMRVIKSPVVEFLLYSVKKINLLKETYLEVTEFKEDTA